MNLNDYAPTIDAAGMPDRIAALKICPQRRVPIPWFVAYLEDGTPEFRLADHVKRVRAIKENLCWVCGQKLGRFLTFVAGPMCGINRTTAEPACHLDCARWSARNCPFLSKPQMVRRENDLPADMESGPGFPILRNPGVSMLWTTRSLAIFRDGRGGWLIEMGPAETVEWFALGKPATRAQVAESIRTGLPALEDLARQQEGALEELARRRRDFDRYLPKS
jgi:hypothetical protein